MPAVTTEGLILKRKNFGEADRVLTVLTDRYGKISMIARGVRRITSRRAGNVEVVNKVKLRLYRSVKNYTLTEAESLETYPKLKENLILATTTFHILELADRLTVENQINAGLYSLVISVLKMLEQHPRQIFVRAYEIKILDLLGFWSVDALKDIDASTKLLLQRLEYAPWQEIAFMEINRDQALVLEHVLRYYIEKILESNLKSMRVLKELKNGQA